MDHRILSKPEAFIGNRKEGYCFFIVMCNLWKSYNLDRTTFVPTGIARRACRLRARSAPIALSRPPPEPTPPCSTQPPATSNTCFRDPLEQRTHLPTHQPPTTDSQTTHAMTGQIKQETHPKYPPRPPSRTLLGHTCRAIRYKPIFEQRL